MTTTLILSITGIVLLTGFFTSKLVHWISLPNSNKSTFHVCILLLLLMVPISQFKGLEQAQYLVNHPEMWFSSNLAIPIMIELSLLACIWLFIENDLKHSNKTL